MRALLLPLLYQVFPGICRHVPSEPLAALLSTRVVGLDRFLALSVCMCVCVSLPMWFWWKMCHLSDDVMFPARSSVCAFVCPCMLLGIITRRRLSKQIQGTFLCLTAMKEQWSYEWRKNKWVTLLVSGACSTCHFLLEEVTLLAHSRWIKRVMIVRNPIEKFQCLSLTQFGGHKNVLVLEKTFTFIINTMLFYYRKIISGRVTVTSHKYDDVPKAALLGVFYSAYTTPKVAKANFYFYLIPSLRLICLQLHIMLHPKQLQWYSHEPPFFFF